MTAISSAHTRWTRVLCGPGRSISKESPNRPNLPSRLIKAMIGTVLFCSIGAHAAAAQSIENGFKIFTNSIVPLTNFGLKAEPTILSNDQRRRMLQLHFTLQTNNFAELEARVARGETISPAEMRERYSGNKSYVERLASWLRTREFNITDTSADFTDVYADATVGQVQESLGVQFAVVTYQGVTTPAAITAPRLPLEIGGPVIAIEGLQPFIQLKPNNVPGIKTLGTRSAADVAQVVTTNLSTPIMVRDIMKAYDADSLGLAGDGETIAILINTFPAMADLHAFWAKNGLAVNDSQIQFVSLQGPGTKFPAPQGEESLDTEWASGIAPGATVEVYATGSFVPADFDRGLNKIYSEALRNSGLRQVSLSIGLREDDFDAGEIATEHQVFVKLAAIGVTVFVSSGDAGSNPDHTGHGRGPTPVVEYEACDSSVVAVGGTVLELDASGNVTGEVGWDGSGGGISKRIPKPQWQPSSTVVSGKGRLVPDVSAAAAPGAFVVLNGKTVAYAGTSWSTPVWAAFSALLAQDRQKQKKPPIGFLAPVFYKLNQGFRDITIGSNGAYKAGPGWDPVTGLGVPDLKVLSLALP